MSRRRKDCNRSKIGSKIGSKKGLEDPEPVSTAINEANRANEANGTAYDLQGRKVVGNRKGVVIIDGTLVLKK